ncbi:MAG: hypothetical protein ACLFTE_07990 [Salinivenus sp.]
MLRLTGVPAGAASRHWPPGPNAPSAPNRRDRIAGSHAAGNPDGVAESMLQPTPYPMQTEHVPRRERVSVSIVFAPPRSDPLAIHERTLDGVPRPIINTMQEDFRAYHEPGTDRSPYQLYRYEDGGQERLIALDFTEVVSLSHH